MADATDDVVREPPVAGDETSTLLGSLERQRATFGCSGLDAAGMRATVGASTMTLLSDGDLGQLARFSEWDDAPSLRRVLIDIIEEYARHVGHADLIRESVDGLVGEDPPR